MKKLLFILLLLPFISHSQTKILGIKKDGAVCPFTLSFGSRTNLTESPAGTYNVTVTTGGTTTEAFASPVSLAASTNGDIRATYNNSANIQFAIILHTSSTLSTPGYNNGAYGVYVDGGGDYVYIESGSQTGTGVAAVAGDIFKLERVSTNTMRIQYFRSGAWTTVFTFSGTQTGQLWPYLSAATFDDTQLLTGVQYCGMN